MQDSKASAPTGMHDILPKNHDLFNMVKKVIRHRCRQAGFRRITTPIFEKTDTLKKAFAESADLVERSLYTLRDPHGEDLVVRPSNTIGIARAYAEHNFDDFPQPISLYYIEQQARYTDKPGYYRFFNQFGTEVIGQDDAALDAQIVYLAFAIFKDLKIMDRLEIQINSFGNREVKDNYVDELKSFFESKKRSVPEKYQHFIERDPIQLFLIQDEDLEILCKMAPKIQDFWDTDSKEYFKLFTEYLDELSIPYTINPSFFRKQPYYSGIIFEFWEKNRGRKKAVGGGGRYDTLIERLSGVAKPAVNFIGGIERIIAQMKISKVVVPNKDELDVFVAQLGVEAKKKCLSLLARLHNRGIKAIGAIGKSSMKEQIAMAESFKAPYMILMGLTEVREGKAIIREMSKGTQQAVAIDKVIDQMVKLIGEDNLDNYSPADAVKVT